MTDLKIPFPFEVTRAACELGENVRIARKRRRLRGAGGRGRGDAGVSIGNVLSVLWVLGLISSAKALADPDRDEHGKTLELARLPKRVRHSFPGNDF